MKTKANINPDKASALGRALAESRRGDAHQARHAQLRAALIRCIEAGHWGPGERLPTEADLIALSGLSLGTVQRALRSLVEEGVVKRRQGSGSYVSDPQQRVGDLAIARFQGDDGDDLLPVYSRVIARRAVARTPALARHFPDSGARILRIDRSLNVNGEFEVASRFYFDGGRYIGLANAPLGDLAGVNFKALLGQESPLPAGEMLQTAQVVAAPRAIARRLGIGHPAIVCLLEIIRTDAVRGQVVFFQQMFIPASDRKLCLLPPA